MAIQYVQAPFRVLDAVSPRLGAQLALRFFTTPRRWPVPAWEQAIAQSAERIWLANGHTGFSWGHGRPVLLVHGWEGRVTQLGRFVEPLVAAGFRVIGFDAPAHGGHRGKALTVLGYAQFLRMVAAEFGPLHGVVAHSMGASAVGFAAQRPLRVGRAVLISAARSVDGVARRFEDLLALGARTRALFRRRLETEVFGAPLAELDLCRNVPAYLPPTLLLATDDDRDMPIEDTQEIAAHWPKARMQIALKAGGHRKVLRDWRVIDAAVRFLTEAAWLPRPLEPQALAAADTSVPATTHTHR
ncbi:MAG TPA: alpha/beta hydrolase [Burkholderiales bacterium]